jgi:hypothetical protein
MRPLHKIISASVVAVSAFAATLNLSSPSEAQQMMVRPGPVCGERTALMNQLKGKYAELPKSMGLAANGSVLEVLTAKTGTWTILLTTPQGVTCLIAAGEHWEDREQQNADYTPS